MTDEARGRWFAPADAGTSSSRDNGAAQQGETSSTPAASSGVAAAKPSFDCNICLDTVSSPVVTLCGHLYCWPCLYQWMESRSECPVCKAGISVENVIPVYSRGADSTDPRTHEMSDNGIPNRPHGQRPDAEQLRRRRPRQFGMFNNQGGFSMSPTIGFFPALFGIPFQPPAAATHRPDGTPLTPMEVRQQMQQAFLSRLLLVVGSLVIFCLLTF